MNAYKLSILFMLLAAPLVHSQATFNVQSSGRGLENAKMGARMQQLHDSQQATIDLLQPQSFSVLPDCDASGEKINWNSGTSTFTCIQEDDPTVSSFAKDPLPSCSGTEFLQGDGTDLSCVDATSVVTGSEIDPTVTDFAKDPLPTCGANEALKGNGTVLSCVAISGAGVESDPTVYSFAQNPLPTCGVGQVLKANGTSLTCVTDTAGGFTESDPLTMSFAKGTLPVCAADEVLSNTDGLGQAFACVDAATAAAGAADDLGNHTATQALDMATYAINNVADPTGAQDAATKAYVDAEVAAGVASVSETDPTVEAFAKNNLPNCTASQLLSGNGTALSCVDAATAAAGAADDMGDHVADQNIQLGSYYLSGDGDDEGLQINTAGDILLGGKTIYQNDNGATGPDMSFTNTALLTSESGFMIAIDSNNDTTGASFSVKKDGTSSAASTVFEVNESGHLDVTGRIRGVTDPTDGQDAATKAYVDAQIAGGSGDSGTLDGLDSTQFLRSDVDDSTTGDLGIGDADIDGALTITGGTNVNSVNTAGQGHIVLQDSAADATGYKLRLDSNELQVSHDNGPSAFTINPYGGTISLGGTSVSSTVTIRGNNLAHVADPTSDHHAATKAYVDAQISGGSGDAGTLDSLDSTQFLRSDVSDTTAGSLGIRTAASADTSLDVLGSVRIRSGGGLAVGHNFAPPASGIDVAGDLMFRGGDAEISTNGVNNINVGDNNDTLTLKENHFVDENVFGISTLSPSSTLHVDGDIQVGNESAACVAAKAGAIRYNSGDIEFCNGTAWGAVSASGADNLGDHTATQNIELAGNWLSGDGDSEGVQVHNGGGVGLGIGANSDGINLHGYRVRILDPGGASQATHMFMRNDAGSDLDFISYHTDHTGGRLLNVGAGSAVVAYEGAGQLALGTTASQPMSFSTNNAERMRINSAGDVGIGTDSPSSTLHVAGDVQIGNSSATCAAATAGAIRYSGGNVEFCNGTIWNTLAAGSGADNLGDHTATQNIILGSNILTNDETPNLGGTVNGLTLTGSRINQEGYSGGGGFVGITVNNRATTGESGIIFQNGPTVNRGSILARTSSSGATSSEMAFLIRDSDSYEERLTLTPDGLGIGTDSPSSTLHVDGDVQIGNSSSACAATTAGAIRYSGGNVEFCNGTTWAALASASGVGNAGGNNTEVQYNGAGTLAGHADFTYNGAGMLALTGDPSTSLYIDNNASTGYGISVNAGHANNNVSAISAVNAGDAGTAVYGGSTSASGTTFGVRGDVASPNGTAIQGYASSSTGATKGVYGQTQSASGIGVMGYAGHASGGMGIYGETAASGGAAIMGYVGNATSTATAVYGETGSNAGASGVMGYATNAAGTSIGVTGITDSASGHGVYADNTAGGPAIGVGTGNIALYDSYISNDGSSNKGLSIDNSGRALLECTNGIACGLIVKNDSSAIGSGSAIGFDVGSNLSVASINAVYQGNSGANHGADLVLSTSSRSGGGVAERMRVDEDGNVGIGTGSPSSTLHVAGDIQVGNSSATCAAATAGAIRYNSGDVEFCNGTAWASVGGTGADNLGNKQDFANGYSNFLRLGIDANNNETTAYAGYLIFNDLADTATTNQASAYFAYDERVSGIKIGTGNVQSATDATAVYLKSDGKFGIGTDSPSSTLHVAGDVTLSNEVTPSLRFIESDNNDLVWDFQADGRVISLGNNYNSNLLQVHASGDTHVTELGIGLGAQWRSPSATLHVGGDQRLDGNLIFSPENNGSNDQTSIERSGGGSMELYADSMVAFMESDDDIRKMRFDVNTAQMSIGDNAQEASSTLYVDGDIQLGNQGMVCAATKAGAIRYNSGNVEFCNGTAWAALASASGVGNAGGNNTEVQYNGAGTLAGHADFTYNGAGMLALTGDPSTSLYIDNNASTGYGISVNTGHANNNVSAISAVNAGDAGTGVYGANTSASGTTFGVRGDVASPNGTAIQGYASSSAGATKGVYGQTQSASGIGVMGYAGHASGGMGIYGETAASGGAAIMGYVGNATSTATAVYGETGSNAGSSGVMGYATNAAGSSIGVTGITDSASGHGVYADNTAGGPAIGVGTGNVALSDSYISNDGGDEGIRIDNSGNVGIGTTAPSATLHVQNNGGHTIFSANALGNGADMKMGSAGFLSADSSMYVGIDSNNNTTDAKFRIVKDIEVDPNTAPALFEVLESGDGVFLGDVTANAYIHSSDRRLKDDIRTVMNPLEIIKKLRGVFYKWKHSGAESAGVIAQEVREVMPSAVVEKADGMLAVEYDQLMAPMIEAIKMQQDQIEELTEKNEAQDQLIQDLISRVEALEQK